ncbi:hypothetical protein BC829DRAFT_419448 [Chytridium lagenaria]|nr:hypothetical protein BC829DRAFT_419448 [Chytridium lagenaria]
MYTESDEEEEFQASGVRVVVPTVYFPPQADVSSEVASVVEGENVVAKQPDPNEFAVKGVVVGAGKEDGAGAEMVIALHAFVARSGKEMSLAKGDVVVVHRRQGTWIYGTKARRKTEDAEGGEEATANGDGKKPEMGWIPVAFVAKYSLQLYIAGELARFIFI